MIGNPTPHALDNLAKHGKFAELMFGAHQAIDPVQAMGGYGGVAAMALPMGKAAGVAAPKKAIYHVTHTKNVPGIRKHGLRRLQTSNWAKSGDKGRYGQGEVYAFENKQDALRWAGKMDWEFNKKTGSGNISIVKLNRSGDRWVVDAADPINQVGAKGKWLKSEQAVGPGEILDAEVLTRDMLRALIK
jgi:hypothetical protein